MSRAQGVDVNRNKVVGLAIANGTVAMAGALLAQYGHRLQAWYEAPFRPRCP